MIARRDFLRRSVVSLAGGLLVGDAALEMFARLNHTKIFALGAVRAEYPIGFIDLFYSSSLHSLSTATLPTWNTFDLDSTGQFTAAKLRKAITDIEHWADSPRRLLLS